ncbi:MAG: prolyl oligopeptidase family serine peptidase [Hyphomonadaceae bacterium]|nr:prolyl oligopeptidase family serine peptidase [Hyphomonadaceae bacterium]
MMILLRSMMMVGAGLLVLVFDAFAEPVSIEDLARQPAMSSVSISADGETMFALVGPSEGDDTDRAVLASWDLNDLSRPPKTVAPEDDEVEFIFVQALKNGYAMVGMRKPFTGRLSGCSEGKFIGSTRTWVRQFFITDAEFSDFENPFLELGSGKGRSDATETCLKMEARGSVVSRLPLDPDNVVISRLDARTFGSEIVRLNLDTQSQEVMYRELGASQVSYLDPLDGEVMATVNSDEQGGSYIQKTSLRLEKGGDLVTFDALDIDMGNRRELDVTHYDRDTGLYLVNTNKFSDMKQIHEFDPQTGVLSEEPLFAHEEFNALGVVTSDRESDFGKILGYAYQADVRRTYWVDPELGGIMLGLENAFPGHDVNLIYDSPDRNRIIFSVSASNQPSIYMLLEDKASLTTIAQQRPWINSEDIGLTELVYYDARDGRRLPALLTPRAGWQPGDEPGKAIVLPHGGPWARDYGGWDISGWVPFLTSRGYTVLQPQYRGSFGWGLDLWRAGDGQYGYKAQDDKDDGAAWLVEQGYAADDKIAIFGYSYGGYAAMAAATRANSPYQCAIAGAGYAESAKINVGIDQSRFGRVTVGSALSGRDVINDVENAEIPILIYHGDRDVRVPDTFGKAFYDAIRRHTTAKYVNIPEMPHSLPWTPDQHRLSLETIESFLQNECGMG